VIDLDQQLTWFNRRLANAHLLHAAPEEVFDAFKTGAAKDERFFCDSSIEAALFARNDPQINLALAAYGENSDVVRALYESSSPKPDTKIVEQYNIELRHACLSNRRVAWLSFGAGLAHILGKDETIPSLLAAGAVADAGVLIANPTVGDQVLASLFNHTDIFEKVEDDVWRSLVGWASNNPRLATENDSPDGPDMGAWRIQEGVQRLLSIAPATGDWALPLVEVLEAIDPSIYHKQIETGEILAKWVAVKAPEYRENSGFRTSLTMSQELCCLIAALYGAPHVESKSAGDAPDDWPARLSRCAHYGKGNLTKADLDDGYARDHGAFAVAVLCNDAVLRDNDLREHLESRCLAGDGVWERYERRCQHLQRRWPWVHANTPDQAEEQPSPHNTAKHELAVAVSELSKSLTGDLESFKRWMAAGFIVVILILLLHW